MSNLKISNLNIERIDNSFGIMIVKCKKKRVIKFILTREAELKI